MRHSRLQLLKGEGLVTLSATARAIGPLMEVHMNRRRMVGFGDVQWEIGQDGKTCSLEVHVNGDIFHLRQLFSRSILISIQHELGRKPSDADLEGLAKVRIKQWVSNGNLDLWPAAFPLTLPAIDYRNADTLIDMAGLNPAQAARLERG